MNHPLLFLGTRTMRNSVARRLGQLKNPRYLIAFVVGAAYLWFALFRGHAGHPRPAVDPAWLELGAMVLGTLLVIWTWVVATERRALVFTPAEVLYLFPAPLPRRTLIHYKLCRAQLMVLLNTMIWTALLSTERLGTGTWFRAASLWVIFSTLHLHRLGASFVRTSLLQHGMSGVRRLSVPLVVAAVLLVGLFALGIGAGQLIVGTANQGPSEVLNALVLASHQPLPAVLLWPFRVMARALAATTSAAWLSAIGPAVAILIAHYVWVIRSDAAFEEAA
ncbi:MAG TPA: putative ABC exporter domain-containing protein, partial [Gemmatimonadales bacterium]|nr:putative ABC exporter domain-containing protein [Gemmatimonadales bacterium]